VRSGDEVTHVVVVRTLGASERRRLRRPRPQPVDPEPEPTAVPTGAVTVILAPEVPDDEASGWLSEASEEGLEEALVVVNQVLQAHRLAAADPYVREVSREGALVARLGYGSGDQVADGRWASAVELPQAREGRRMRRTSALRPQERLAALLGGRDTALACEDLVLRTRTDLDAGRDRAAALQLRVALEAALAELEAEGDRVPDMPDRLTDLRDRRSAIGEAANQALHSPLSPESLTAVTETVDRLEAALRARSAAGFD
jgi:hypothetical protein